MDPYEQLPPLRYDGAYYKLFLHSTMIIGVERAEVNGDNWYIYKFLHKCDDGLQKALRAHLMTYLLK
jgi:hypothetical protein